jgi:hypothetical protein
MKLLRIDSSARRNFHAEKQKTGELGESRGQQRLLKFKRLR